MNFNELFPLKVFINLDRRTDRLELCKKEFAKLNINPIRKSGVVFTQAYNAYLNGMIGCMISHYQILAAALNLGVNVAIFEDDVEFINDPKENLELACNELNDIKWDMLYIGGNILKPFYKISEHLAKLQHCQSTVSYAVNHNFLEKLLGYIDLQHISIPIDMIFAEKVIPENNCLITVPMLAVQADSFSDIEQTEVQYSNYLEKRYLENLKR